MQRTPPIIRRALSHLLLQVYECVVVHMRAGRSGCDLCCVDRTSLVRAIGRRGIVPPTFGVCIVNCGQCHAHEFGGPCLTWSAPTCSSHSGQASDSEDASVERAASDQPTTPGPDAGPSARARPTCKLKLNMTSYNMPHHPISSPLHSITVFSLVLNTEYSFVICVQCGIPLTSLNFELIINRHPIPGPTGVQTES